MAAPPASALTSSNPSTIAQEMSRDPGTFFVNGRILAKAGAGLEGQPTFADSMFVRNGVIAAIGSRDNIASQLNLPADVTVTDLNNKTVLPGFVDGHMHIFLLGQSLRKVDLKHCKNLDDIRATVKAYATSHPEVPRILCKGWMHSMTPGDVTASLLDDIDPRAIFIDSKDLHFTWCNSAGLAELGVADMPDPAGGTIYRDADGKPSGVLSEGAVLSIVWPHQALVASPEDRQAAILAAIQTYSAAGYTGLVEMAMDEPIWDALIALRASNPDLLPMRIAAYWLIKPAADPEARLRQVRRAAELHAQLNATTSPDLRIAGIKVICDGVIDACTAFVSEPYGAPGPGSPTPHGPHPPPIWTPEDLAPVVRAADDAGLQIALHAIGDAAVRTAVDALENLHHASPGRQRRHRIEHLELVSPEDAKRLGKAGITASIQPVHADPAILRAWPRLLGRERCGRAFAYREFADGGALLALGSDSPTAPWEPLHNVYVATTRRSAREPECEEVVNEHFRLGVCEAIAAATEGTAASVFAEGRVGSLAVGKMADFAVFDMEWDAKSLLKSALKETWFSGRRVFKSEK
ncbi:amidohydrolase family protein [Sodiomyces alkalinus F11]|uniref:Amidohydrolase family protein n=1 Tax=Sodiomyces alkalinus (strain CBS 110278 / VKM F-3762 / F11) TaxID=1314773 RepID=A0A3N2PV35_SODAK|nr:amidohydrolase family protein [Sodiomyces alkalinus F11]ROT38206.1 amidohydrolase family protein [Sodiomyces alkalinus F11]